MYIPDAQIQPHSLWHDIIVADSERERRDALTTSRSVGRVPVYTYVHSHEPQVRAIYAQSASGADPAHPARDRRDSALAACRLAP